MDKKANTPNPGVNAPQGDPSPAGAGKGPLEEVRTSPNYQTGIEASGMDGEDISTGATQANPQANASAVSREILISPWLNFQPRALIWIGIGLAAAISLGWVMLRGGSPSTATAQDKDKNAAASIPVRTAFPTKKVLQRKLTLPVTIQAASQAELFAKTSGYLKAVQREWTSDSVKEIFARSVQDSLPLVTHPATWTMVLAHRFSRNFGMLAEKDIGSYVHAGECLLEIDNPEQLQDLAEKASLVKQKEAEYESAVSAITTIEASVESVKAQKAQAESDILKCKGEHTFRVKQLSRLESLVRDGTIVPEILDEKNFQTKAALAAWDSSKAKLALIDAEIKVISSKLATARADLKVKESMIQVARDAYQRARVIASYTKVLAPFDGVITYRGVDVGDFIQNAGSGRPLLTVCAIDRIRLIAQVPERSAPWIKAGRTEAIIHDIDALEGFELKALVARTSHSLDPASRTMQVEVEVENKEGGLLPGMYGQITFNLQRIENAFAIPASAVNSRKGSNFILLVKNGVAHRQPVRIVYDDGLELQVLKQIDGREVPLDGTEELIVTNKGEIADGQQVAAVQ